MYSSINYYNYYNVKLVYFSLSVMKDMHSALIIFPVCMKGIYTVTVQGQN